MTTQNTVQIKVNTGVFKGFSEGQVLTLPCDAKGTPRDRFWRRRLKDAAHDNCCEIVTQNASAARVADKATEGIDNG